MGLGFCWCAPRFGLADCKTRNKASKHDKNSDARLLFGFVTDTAVACGNTVRLFWVVVPEHIKFWGMGFHLLGLQTKSANPSTFCAIG